MVRRGPFAYIANGGSNTVSVIDLGAKSVVKEVAVGMGPAPTTLGPDGTHMYVFSRDGSISSIDTSSYAVKTSQIGALYVNAIQTTPDGLQVYASGGQDARLWIVDAKTLTLVRAFSVYNDPRSCCDNHNGLVFSPDGRRLYVTNVGFGGGLHQIAVVETATAQVIGSIDTVAQGPIFLALDPGRNLLYATQEGYMYNGNSVSVIDLRTNQRVASITVGTTPSPIVLNSKGSVLYVGNTNSDTVSVIDTATRTVSRTIGVGKAPVGLALTADDEELVVVNLGSDNVSIVKTATMQVSATVPVGKSPASTEKFVSP